MDENARNNLVASSCKRNSCIEIQGTEFRDLCGPGVYIYLKTEKVLNAK